MVRRIWLPTLVVVLLATTAVAVVVARSGTRCGDSVTSRSADASRSPFLDAGKRRAQPDPDRDRLVSRLQRAPGPPFGQVLGAVGYHYEQWIQLSAFTDGIGVRTRDNPDFTLLDDASLRPRWSVRVATTRSTWDADGRRYLVAPLPATAAPELVALDLRTGRRRWCLRTHGSTVRAGDPFGTLLRGDEVLVLGPDGLARYDGPSGDRTWNREAVFEPGATLGDLGSGVAVAGGVDDLALLDEQALARRPAGTALVAVARRDGTVRWRRPSPAGSATHVVGTDPAAGAVVLAERSKDEARARLVALDRSGHQLWTTTPGGGVLSDAAVRTGRVLVRTGTRWSAYDLLSGKRLWQRTVPQQPQFVPYGFRMDDVPLLDADHALVGSTTALRELDLRTGAMPARRAAPLPRDGISTTYWPYQVVASAHATAVATNTGAVVLRRR